MLLLNCLKTFPGPDNSEPTLEQYITPHSAVTVIHGVSPRLTSKKIELYTLTNFFIPCFSTIDEINLYSTLLKSTRRKPSYILYWVPKAATPGRWKNPFPDPIV